MALNDILKETGVTKGALYHHFPNKKALGLAVVASIRRMVQEFWLDPLADTDDPIAGLEGILGAARTKVSASRR